MRTESDSEGDARSSIAEDIAAGYRSDVLPGLLTALQSRSPHIVRAACGAVRKLGTEAAPAVPILTSIAQALLPKNADIQQEYARMDALHALNDILGEIERVRQREARRAEDIESAEKYAEKTYPGEEYEVWGTDRDGDSLPGMGSGTPIVDRDGDVIAIR